MRTVPRPTDVEAIIQFLISQVRQQFHAPTEQRLILGVADGRTEEPSVLLGEAQDGGSDLRQVWAATTTTDRDRKELLRTLLEEVVLNLKRAEGHAHLTLRWRGGAITTVDVPVPRFRPKGPRTDEDTISLLRRLAALYPDEVIRLVILGQRDKVLNSRTIWVCAACETCTTRCPNGVKIAEVMDCLKEMAIAQGVPCPQPQIEALHETFLENVKLFGRVFEGALLPVYMLRSGEMLRKFNEGNLMEDMRMYHESLA